MRNIVFQALAEAARSGEPVALGIITGAKGSSPQKVGAKALFYADGRIQGTLGGGCLEAEIQQRAVRALRSGQAATFDLLLDHDFGWDDGLMCGGKVCGVILPNAQKAGEQFWSELAERKQTMEWGVKGDYSISRALKRARRRAGDWAPADLALPGDGHGAVRAVDCGRRPHRASGRAAGVAVGLQRNGLRRPAGAGQSPVLPARGRSASRGVGEAAGAAVAGGAGFGLIVTRGHRHDALVLKEWIHRPFLFWA